MFFSRRILPIVLIFALGLLSTGCQEKTTESQDGIFPIFGGRATDTSPVIARVADVEITQQDLDYRFDELVPKMQRHYKGEEGKQLLLKEMIDEVLLVKGAMERKLQNREEVARTLVTQRRVTMVSAMKNLGIPEKNVPTEDELQSFFKDNRKEFMQLALIHARHIECLSFDKAQEAYELLKEDHSPFNFMKVAGEFSVNKKTLARDADLGWFNKTGMVADILGSNEFIEKTADLPVGLHAPIQVGERWHVVQILARHEERPMTYNEARDLVKSTMLPAYYDGKIKDFLLAARKTTPVEMLGVYAPGKGLSPEELMKRASAVVDPFVKLNYYRMIYSDFPTSDKADDALFMCTLVSMDTWQDRRMAERYLKLLIEEYPDSELHDDAIFLRDNMYKPGGMNPASIEELRKK